MKTEIISVILLLDLILSLTAAELITIHKLNTLEQGLLGGDTPQELYLAFRDEEAYFAFIFSREEIRELELSFFEYTLSEDEEGKSRLGEEISHLRRQLLLFFG